MMVYLFGWFTLFLAAFSLGTIIISVGFGTIIISGLRLISAAWRRGR
jgi:hypothetical protein